MQCRICGADTRVEAFFCASCGNPVDSHSHTHHEWFSEASSLRRSGRFSQAVLCFNRALSSWPKKKRPVPDRYHARAWHDKGLALMELKRAKEAVECYDRAIRLCPTNDKPWFNKAVALMELGQAQDALYAISRGLKINPRDYLAWFTKANWLRYKVGDEEGAQYCFRRAERLINT